MIVAAMQKMVWCEQMIDRCGVFRVRWMFLRQRDNETDPAEATLEKKKDRLTASYAQIDKSQNPVV